MSTSLPTELTIAGALQDYRARHGLTQTQLAKRLRVPVRSLQTYEAGAMPHTKRRRKILALLAKDAAGSAAA